MVNSPMRSGGGGASGRHASSGQHYSLSRIAAVVLGFALLIALVYVFEHQHDALQAANANAASSLITMGARGAARGSMRPMATSSSSLPGCEPLASSPGHQGGDGTARETAANQTATQPPSPAPQPTIVRESPSPAAMVRKPAPPALQPVNGSPPPLSAELARAVAVNGTLILAVGNFAVLEFVRSWAFHVRKQGYTNYLVGATDLELGKALVEQGIQCFALYNETHPAALSTRDLPWNLGDWGVMGRLKVDVMRTVLSYGLHVVALDTDIMVLGDMLSDFERFPEADVLMSSDLLRSTVEPGDSGLELPRPALEAQDDVNMGLMLLRSRPSTRRMVDAWRELLRNDSKMWDQGGLNKVVRLGLDDWDNVTTHPKAPRVVMCMNGSLALGVLPVSRYQSGHTAWAQRLHEVQRLTPLAVHPTFTFGGNMGKKARLRDSMLMDDPPSYWTDDAYVMVNVPRGPSMTAEQFEKAFNASQKKTYHLRMLRVQMQPVYAGIALAHLFNRSIILPRLACYCDKNWNPLVECRTIGATQMRLPFLCPMDYVLDPGLWTAPLSDTSVIINPRWREPSFLDNPRCPPDLKTNKITVFVNETLALGAAPEESWTAQDGLAVALPPDRTDQQLRDALQPYERVKIWRFADAAATFKAFSDPATQRVWEERLAALTSCVNYWELYD